MRLRLDLRQRRRHVLADQRRQHLGRTTCAAIRAVRSTAASVVVRQLRELRRCARRRAPRPRPRRRVNDDSRIARELGRHDLDDRRGQVAGGDREPRRVARLADRLGRPRGWRCSSSPARRSRSARRSPRPSPPRPCPSSGSSPRPTAETLDLVQLTLGVALGHAHHRAASDPRLVGRRARTWYSPSMPPTNLMRTQTSGNSSASHGFVGSSCDLERAERALGADQLRRSRRRRPRPSSRRTCGRRRAGSRLHLLAVVGRRLGGLLDARHPVVHLHGELPAMAARA